MQIRIQEPTVFLSLLIDEAKDLMEQGHYERAAQIFQECLQLELGSKMRVSILDDLGYCLLRLGLV